MPVHILDSGDLDPVNVRLILDSASALLGSTPDDTFTGKVLGVVFLDVSLRTRLGYSVAASRLGMSVVDVGARRWTQTMSDAESFGDTIRTVAGMTDVVVARAPFRFDRGELAGCCPVPFINGGDAQAHPTQALVDLFAMEQDCGPISELAVTIVGDLSSRVVKSLVDLLGLFCPRTLSLVGPPGRDFPDHLPESLVTRTLMSSELDVADTDVLYVAGLPAAGAAGAPSLDGSERRRYAVTGDVLASMSGSSIILSPLPVVDELDSFVRADSRMRAFVQSDRGVAVRQALLNYLLAGGDVP